MSEAITSIEPFTQLFDENHRPATIAVIATAGACVAGANIYGAIYKTEQAKQGQITTEVSSLDHGMKIMTAEDNTLIAAEHDLAKYGIHVSKAVVHRAVDANIGRIKADQTKAMTLQREYPHIPPTIAFDMTPIVLGFVGLGTYIALEVRHRDRKADSKAQADRLTESQPNIDQ